mgnify:CR=1 FL=1
MTLTIPDEVIAQAHLTDAEWRVEFAVFLYEKKRLTMGQARKLAGLDLISFQHELAQRDVFIHYDEQDLATDLRNLNLG